MWPEEVIEPHCTSVFPSTKWGDDIPVGLCWHPHRVMIPVSRGWLLWRAHSYASSGRDRPKHLEEFRWSPSPQEALALPNATSQRIGVWNKVSATEESTPLMYMQVWFLECGHTCETGTHLLILVAGRVNTRAGLARLKYNDCSASALSGCTASQGTPSSCPALPSPSPCHSVQASTCSSVCFQRKLQEIMAYTPGFPNSVTIWMFNRKGLTGPSCQFDYFVTPSG